MSIRTEARRKTSSEVTPISPQTKGRAPTYSPRITQDSIQSLPRQKTSCLEGVKNFFLRIFRCLCFWKKKTPPQETVRDIPKEPIKDIPSVIRSSTQKPKPAPTQSPEPKREPAPILRQASRPMTEITPIRGTKHQFSEKDASGNILGRSACTSQAISSIIAFRGAFQKNEVIDGPFLDGILDQGRAMHFQALRHFGKQDGYNFMASEAIAAAGLSRSITVEQRFEGLTSESQTTYRNILLELQRQAEASREKIASAVLTRGPESCSIMARKLENGSYQFYFFDSHGEPTVRPLAVYLQRGSLEQMAVYINTRHPFTEGFEDLFFDNNNLDISYLTFT